MTPMTQGAANNERLGREIYVKNIRINLYLEPNATATLPLG